MLQPITHNRKTFTQQGRARTPRYPVQCSRCKVSIPAPAGQTCAIGYALTRTGRKLCYPCAWVRQRADMVRTGFGVLYLTLADPEFFDVVGPYLGPLAPGVASYSEHKGRFPTRAQAEARAAECTAERARATGPGMPDLPPVLVKPGPRAHKVTTWCGTWSAPTLRVRTGRAWNPFACRWTRRDRVTFTGPDGRTWHGQCGESMQCFRAHRSKKD